MFDFLDWGHNMGYTTNELARVSPFMGNAAGLFFVIAGLMGIYMLYQVIKKKENGLLITLFHVTAGATAFALLIMQIVAGSASGDPMHPSETGWLPQALLFTGAVFALGGFVWRQRLRQRRSYALIYSHVAVALMAAGFLWITLLEINNMHG